MMNDINNMNNFMNNPNNIFPFPINNMSNIQIVEDKIKSLEEKIAQKESELKNLKDELNSNNLMKMNMVRFNNLMNPINNPSPQSKKISVNLQFDIQNSIECNENDMSYVLKDKLYFIHNHQPINLYKKISENKIFNGATIKITDKILKISFETSTREKTIISFDENCPIRKAVEIYCFNTIDAENNFKKVWNCTLIFIYNATKLDVFKETPIKQIFGDNPFARVVVIDTGITIG